MLKSITYNPQTKETTYEYILTAEDEPCGKDTNFKYNYELNAK